MQLFLFPIKFDYGSTFPAALVETSELVTNSSPVAVDPSHFHGTLHKAKSENDQNSWSAPGGEKFMIRGKTYLTDYTKVGRTREHYNSYTVNYEMNSGKRPKLCLL